MSHDNEMRICSQCGQDGILREIFKYIGFSTFDQVHKEGKNPDEVTPYFVEFGARKPNMLNSAWLRKFCGWKGLLMDFQPGMSKHGGILYDQTALEA